MEKAHNTQNLDENVKHLQLVNSLTTNDTDAVLNAIFRINAHPFQGATPTYGSPLHLVVSLCPKNIVENVVSVFCSSESAAAINGKSLDWINVQNTPDRETPLHIASKLGRIDIIELLFQIPNLNDTVRQVAGKTAEEIAANGKVAHTFAKYRTEYIEAMTAAIHNAAVCNDHQGIEELFANSERAKGYLKLGWIDINASIEPSTERSLLHVAAKSDNLEMVVWALKFGADPNVMDKKGKKPFDLAKSDKVRDILKHSKSQAPITSASLAQAAAGKVGIKEAPVLKGNLLKWTNYKDGYQSRYFVLEGGVFSYFHDIHDYPSACRGSISTLSVNAYFPDPKNDPSRFDVTGSGNVKYSLKARSPADAKKWVWSLMESRVWMSDAHKHPHSGTTSPKTSSVDLPNNSSPQIGLLVSTDSDGFDGRSSHIGGSPPSTVVKLEDHDTPNYLGDASPEIVSPELRRLIILVKTEMQVQQESVQTAVDILNQTVFSSQDTKSANTMKPLPKLLTESSKHIEDLINNIIHHCHSREKVWEQKLKSANDAHKRLEDIVQRLATVDSMPGQHPGHLGLSPNVLTEKQHLAIPSNPSSRKVSGVTDGTSPVALKSADESDYSRDSIDDEFYDAQDLSQSFFENAFGFPDMQADGTDVSKLPDNQKIFSLVSNGFLPITDLETCSKGYESLIPHRSQLPLDPSIPMPSLAVWSFLKSAIGKDLSKITLPVLFNEPLSMLQRMCEDVEFIELLSLAGRVGSKGLAPPSKLDVHPGQLAAIKLDLDYDSLVNLQSDDASLFRVMLVGAFAMSNYSSTVGRTSKPFNPLLGETFELIQPEKQFRYLSEQVCHHPPISACYCESPDYSFWTEVNVKSKFWGKSLELHPLGNCHVSLPVYNEKGECQSEHYSWKKVTTCVNNLILGTLTIEHYGDMIVKNWRTGEECVITFKLKDSGGWFGSNNNLSSDTITGTVKDAKGVCKYEIKGKWDEQITAYPVGKAYPGKPFCLWKVNQKPAASKVNFNFTDFSLYLNQTSDELQEILPDTDSRKRPDQRAMELGLWDEADVKKEFCEQHQRARRKEIVANYEKTGIPNGPPPRGIDTGESWWSPRWFIREIEKDTNEGHWRFSDEYWKIREGVSDNTFKWPEYVEDIFGLHSNK
ncbi:hypothetical protein HDV06_004692 [Boothiomyces sp. JEL0866]|nr:hypothetical protein HDV06_004692 [Boothiomyces sp. JEL0866]